MPRRPRSVKAKNGMVYNHTQRKRYAYAKGKKARMKQARLLQMMPPGNGRRR